ncbi:uncharacterized protein LOC117329368 [Pecten maximus]|uniref:uncharacterized protein LOC117329368 n=1 Tax=Pecten maximus TaxID=6579 RepID=UPI00145892EF|nr:uncharacterized protein LOC117329368 [Pecten maximus]
MYWILTLGTFISAAFSCIDNNDKCIGYVYKYNPCDSSTYYHCVHGGWIQQPCPPGTEWTHQVNTCVTGYNTSCPFDPASTASCITLPPTTAVTINNSEQCPNVPPGICMCPKSPNPKYINITREELQEILEELKRELVLKKSSLAMHIRKKISAKDNRTSSQIMGYTGALMLGTPILIIVMSDVVDLFRFLLSYRRKRTVSVLIV